MPRVKFHPWQKGLWTTGDKHTAPESSLRKARGLHPTPRPTLRSRPGSLKLFEYGPGPPHSLYRFNNKTIAGVGNGIFLDAAPGLYLGNGNRLAFVKAPATLANTDLLYIAGGGILELVTPAGQFFKWGTDAPPDGAQAYPQGALVATFGNLSDVTQYTAGPANADAAVTYGSGVRLVAQKPTASISDFPYYTFPCPGDFSVFGGAGLPSLEGDYIELNAIIETPADLVLHVSFDCTDGTFAPGNAIYSRSIVFTTIDDPLFFQTTFEKPAAPIPPTLSGLSLGNLMDNRVFSQILSGFGENQLHINQAIKAYPTQLQRQQFLFNRYGVGVPANVADIPQHFTSNNWVRIRIPKNSFGLSDPLNTGQSWSTVQAMRLGFEIAATATYGAIQLSQNLNLVGGSPLKGLYKYRFTFINNVTGARSNPNPAHDGLTLVSHLDTAINNSQTTLTLANTTPEEQAIVNQFPTTGLVRIDRELIYYTGRTGNQLTGLTRWVPSGPAAHSQFALVSYEHEVQANADREPINLIEIPPAPSSDFSIEIWRTLANNDVFFLNDRIAWNEAQYADTTADSGTAEHVTMILGSDTLPLDNDPPLATWNDAVGPHQGRMWWGRDSASATQNQIYFSPSGRYESVESNLIITHTEDQVQKLVIWNTSLWAFTQHHIVQITGEGTDSSPFGYQHVVGAPGTRFPFSVVPTPSGIAYFADDGLRLFTGQESQLIGWEAMWEIFKGETVEGITFPGSDFIVAASTPSEYLMSDGITTLAFNLLAGTWRSLGLGFDALYYDPQTGQLLGSYNIRLSSVVVEDPTTNVDNEDGTFSDGLLFEVETISAATQVDATILVQRIYAEVNCNDQVLLPTLVLDTGDVALPTITGNGRKSYEWSVNATCKTVGFRLAGAPRVRKTVEVFRVEVDIYEGTTQ